MKTYFLRVVVGIALVTVGYMWGRDSLEVVHAQLPSPNIPRAWGHVVAIAQTNFVFEAADGTIRLVNSNTGQAIVTYDRR